MKFKSNIESQAGIEDSSGSAGTAGQILSSLGPIAGVDGVDWIDPANIVTSATDVIIECKNTSGITIAKGTPVYQTGNVGATAVIEVAVADASDEDKMAAIGLLQSDLINNAFGYVVVTGELLNITTSPIDGVTPTIGDTIYVKPGGGLTLTKPTGVNFIQNVGLVGKVSGGNAGSLTVSSIMRSNDVPTPLYIDHDNQRLGVGETSPDVKLHVAGDDTAAAFSTVLKVESTADEGSVQDIHIYNQYDRDIGIKFETLGGENYIWQDSNSDDALIFSTGGSNRTNDAALILEQDQDVIVPNGKLGVGLSSPSTTLHVGGFTRMNGGLQMNTANATIYQIQDSALRFGTNNTERMRIDSIGNVGIGTTSPAAGLQVALGGTNIPAAGASTASAVFGNSTSDDNYGVAIGANSSGVGYISSQRTDGTATTYNLAIQPNGGNVGIGTTSPSTKLNISSASFNDHITLTRSTDELGISVSGGQLMFEGGVSPFNNNNEDLGRSDKYWKELFVYSVRSGGGLQFKTSGNNERMRITSAGNVGIGTTNPTEALMVEGWIRVANNTGIKFNTSASSGDPTLNIDSSAHWNFLNTAGNNLLKIDNGGNVGIGTTSPSEKLDVNGNIKVDNALLSNQENTDIDSAAAEVVAQVAHATYTAAFFDFVVKKGANVRSGTVYACHDGTNVEFTETSTNDLGDTSGVTLSVDKTSTNLRLIATVASDDWSVKSLIRAI
jgi:hypothetical protein